MEFDSRKFSAVLAQYRDLNSRTTPEILRAKGVDLAFKIAKGFRGEAPARGSIRSTRLSALQAGSGVRIRKSVRDATNKMTIATTSDVASRKAGGFMEASKGKKGGTKKNARSWWQIAVTKELNLRESAIGFASVAAMFQGLAAIQANGVKRFADKFKRMISQARLRVSGPDAELVLEWGGGISPKSNQLAAVFNQPRFRSHIKAAFKAVQADMMIYIDRKLRENARKVGMG